MASLNIMTNVCHKQRSDFKPKLCAQQNFCHQLMVDRLHLADPRRMKLRIREFRRREKLSLEELAHRVGVSVPYLSQIERLANDKRPDTDLLHRIAQELDVPTGWLIADEAPVAVVARVGAGARVAAIDDHMMGDGLYQVACPFGLNPRNVVAVEVEGESMFPAYSPGDVLFFTRQAYGVPSEVIGTRAVCVDESGDGWVKLLKAGSEPGLFNLISLNPAADNQHDVRLKWAATVELPLSSSLVEKL